MTTPDQKKVIDCEYEAAERIVHAEIGRWEDSQYWIGSKERHIASPDDYDRKRLATDLQCQFPHLHPDAITSLIESKIYHLHLR